MNRSDRTSGRPDGSRPPLAPLRPGQGPDGGSSRGDSGWIGRLEEVAAAIARGGARPADHSAWEDEHLRSLARSPGEPSGYGDDGDDDPPPESIGKYRVIRELGRGGFGVVYQARDPDLRRDVAVKVPLPGVIPTAAVRKRFVREALAVAVLDHPNIVPVHDADVVGPVAYIVSACCTGPSLAAWLRDRADPVPPRVAAAMVEGLARGVEHAHGRGILHRDLKPANVVLQPGGDPESAGMTPRLTDFGLARLADEVAGDQTGTGMVIGSVPYMAPEQAAARHGEVGPATDVYALGATLYEVLVGRPPFEGRTRAEVWAEVLEAEPVPPRSRRADVPRDLETICLRALRKDQAGRYPTAEALADDLRRFLDGEAIRARPESLAGRCWRRARRHPAPAAVLASGAAALVLAGLIAGWVAARGRAEVISHRHAARLSRARQAIDAGQPERAQEILDTADEFGPPRRDFAWRHLWQASRRELAVWGHHDAKILALALAPDGSTLASSDASGTIRLWDVATGVPGAEFREPAGTTELVAFSPDGTTLAAAGGPDVAPGSSTVVSLRAIADGRILGRFRIPGAGSVYHLQFCADGRTLLAGADLGDGARAIRGWDLAAPAPAGPTPIPRLAIDGPDAVAFDPDGRWAWARDPAGHARRLDLATGRSDRAVDLDPGERQLLAASPDGRYLATSGAAPFVFVRDFAAGGPPRVVAGGAGAPSELRFSPDSATLLVVTRGLEAQLVSMAGGPAVEVTPDLPGRAGRLDFDFAPDGRLLTSRGGYQPGGSQPMTLRDAAGRVLATSPGRHNVNLARFDPSGRAIFQASERDVGVWRPYGPPHEPVELFDDHGDEVWSVAFAPVGRALASGGEDHRIRFWGTDSKSRGGSIVEAHDATVAALAWHPGGRTLASGSLGEVANLKLWDAEGRLIATLPGHTRQVRAVAYAPDGSLLASAGSDRAILLWDGTTGAPRGRLDGHGDVVRGLAFAPDGRHLASASNDNTVRVWDLARRRATAVHAEREHVAAVAYAPDGSLLASADEGGIIRLRDAATGASLRDVISEDHELRALAFSPEGNALAAGGKFGSIRVWDPTTAQQLLELRGATATQINALAFAPDGSTLVAADHDGHALIYHAPHPPRDSPGRR